MVGDEIVDVLGVADEADERFSVATAGNAVAT
jgi:hypothetical protein